MNEERKRTREGDEMTTKIEADTPAPVQRLRTVRARDLLGAERILRIEHDGQVYTLRITRNERLILTK